MEELKHQRWIGAGVMALLAAVVAFMLVRENRKIGPGLTVWVEMAHAGPLVQGSKVRVAGLTVGQVEEVTFLPRRGRGQAAAGSESDDEARVALKLWINRRHAWLLHEKNDYFINQPALLSEPYLEVGVPEHGDPGPALTSGAVVRGVDPASIDRLLNRSYALLRALDAMVQNDFPEFKVLGREIDELEVGIKGLAEEPGLAHGHGFSDLIVEATRTKLWFDQASKEMQGLPGTLAHARTLLTQGRTAVTELRQHVTALTARIDSLRGQLSPERMARISAALERVDVLTKQLDETLASAEALVATIARGEGSLAAFAQDMEIADEVKQVTKMLKEQPWLLGHPLKQ